MATAPRDRRLSVAPGPAPDVVARRKAARHRRRVPAVIATAGWGLGLLGLGWLLAAGLFGLSSP